MSPHVGKGRTVLTASGQTCAFLYFRDLAEKEKAVSPSLELCSASSFFPLSPDPWLGGDSKSWGHQVWEGAGSSQIKSLNTASSLGGHLLYP